MALKDFLYRCPACGHDPVQGDANRVRCPSCQLEVEGGRRAGSRLSVRAGADSPWERVLASELADAVAAHGGARTRAFGDDGLLHYEAAVRVRTAGTERPLRYEDRLLGFAERFGPGVPGLLRLENDRLVLLNETGADELRSWSLGEIQALQGSSSTVQITTEAGGLTLFRFPDDSPRRWDELLRFALNRRWEAEGKGPIAEFQPRIRTTDQLRLGAERP